MSGRGRIGVPAAVAALVAAPTPWANRPVGAALSALPFGYTKVFDVGGSGRSLWWADTVNVVWRPAGYQCLYLIDTQITGLASASSQQIIGGATIKLPRSLLQGLKRIEIAFALSKSGTTDAATTVAAYLGTAGTSSDAQIYTTSSFTAPNRVFSGGIALRYNSATNKVQSLVAAHNIPLVASGAHPSAYPPTQTAAMSDVDQFLSLYVTMAGTTDIPALETLSIFGC